jgi:hypothetical protein
MLSKSVTFLGHPVVLVALVLIIFALLQRDPGLSDSQNAALISKDAAQNLCMDTIENAATNRSSINYHSFTSPPVVRKITEGRLDVFVKFSAKNSFGSESTLIARCILAGDGKTLLEFNVHDS